MGVCGMNWEVGIDRLTLLILFQGGASGKESACQRRRRKRHGFYPWVGKIPWRRKRQCTPVFLPGEFHGQRSLAGYIPWGHKESDTTECTRRRKIGNTREPTA